MKPIILIILSLTVTCNEKTNNGKEFCNLLNEAFSSETLQREFTLCKDGTSFVLYDKKNVLKRCDLFHACGKEIQISYDEKYGKLSPNDNLPTKDRSIIILHRVEVKGKNYELYFWRPYSGASVNLTYRKRGNKFDLVREEIGAF